MVRGFYHFVRKAWKKPRKNLGEIMNDRLYEWRRQSVVERVETPMRLDRAHTLGYKAKKGFVIVRVRVKKGGRSRELYGRRGRKPKKAGLTKFTPKKSLEWTAEEKAAKKFQNMEILGSYFVGEDGKNKWFECVLVDPNQPEIINDRKINWIRNQRRRVFRGLTAAGKESRGL
jgi:large subunit ribosomal protein L15e